jgi:hypothetical protein
MAIPLLLLVLVWAAMCLAKALVGWLFYRRVLKT